VQQADEFARLAHEERLRLEPTAQVHARKIIEHDQIDIR